jgi:catechol 2,3-dioxygenase-like lactoylglutathione lyase family enzyme
MTTETISKPATETAAKRPVDFKLEVVVLPIADANRTADFYGKILGWRVDADFPLDDHGGRILQVTPPGSPTSLIFGTGVSSAQPGQARSLFLVVPDIEAADADLAARGVATSGVFHDANGGFTFWNADQRAPGPDPDRRTYASFATFEDPDGNSFLLQEVTTRLPGRIAADATTFASEADLAAALTRAETAHGVYETARGQGRDAEWPEWYAAFLAAEQSGAAAV